MKKLLTILLVVITALSLTTFMACDDETNPPNVPPVEEPPSTNQSITENQWKDMLSTANFENYTLKQSYSVILDENSTTVDTIIKFADDKVFLSMSADNETHTVLFEKEEAKAQKQSYENLFLALLANFDDYEYDANENAYKNPETITVEQTIIYPTTDGTTNYVVHIKSVMSNGKATVSTDGKLLTFVCDYTQTTTFENGEEQVTDTKMSWTFSDYGTTVITETAE